MKSLKMLPRKSAKIKIPLFSQKLSKMDGEKSDFCPFCRTEIAFSDKSMYSYCSKCDKIILKTTILSTEMEEN